MGPMVEIHDEAFAEAQNDKLEVGAEETVIAWMLERRRKPS